MSGRDAKTQWGKSCNLSRPNHIELDSRAKYCDGAHLRATAEPPGFRGLSHRADAGRCISVLFEHAVLDGFARRVSSKLPGLIVRSVQQSVYLPTGHHGTASIGRFGGITRASGPGVRMVIDSALPMRLGLHAVLLFS
jgi:hypothetical protein